MTDYIGIYPGGRNPTVAVFESTCNANGTKTYSFSSSHACGMFYTDADADEEYHSQTVELTDRLADFTSVILDKTLEMTDSNKESIKVAMTYPLGFTDLELRKFWFALDCLGIDVKNDMLIPAPLAVAYSIAIREGIDPNGMEFVLAEIDDTRCNVLVAKLVICHDRYSMVIRSFVTKDHPCNLDYDEFAESFIRKELAYTIGCNPDNLLISLHDTMFIDVAFEDVKDNIIDGDFKIKVNLVCASGEVGRIITREGFALSVAPASVGLTKNIIRALDQAQHSPTNSVLKHGLKVLGGLGELDALIVCGHSPYARFGSDMVKAIISEFTDRTFCIDWPEYNASLGAAMLASRCDE